MEPVRPPFGWSPNAYNGGRGAHDPYYCEWAAVVGDRVRRLRRARGWCLKDLATALIRPEDRTCFSGSFLSRLERGRGSARFYTYVAIAHALGVEAGVLLGPDSAFLDATEAEAMLLRCLRDLGIEPHAALATIAGQRRESA
jgi:transcriptional regulator with XRE-family HTH domain